MALPVVDPNECLDQVIADVGRWMATGQVPDIVEAAGHGSSVLGALLHTHDGLGSGLDDGKLTELAAACGVEQPDADALGAGPLVTILLPMLLQKFGPIVAAWIIKMIEDRT